MTASGAASTISTGLRPCDYAGHVGSPREGLARPSGEPHEILTRIDRALALLDRILARLDGEDTAREVTGR